MKSLGLGLAIGCASCAWWKAPAPIQEDPSVVIPSFFDRAPVEIGATDNPYVLDGVVLRAIQVAADDFLPPSTENQACWKRREAHRYQVIRQDQVIFVRIDENLEACGLQYVSLDTGVVYAISAEGRILRRVFDAQPAAPPPPAEGSADAGMAAPDDAGVLGSSDPLSSDGGHPP